MNNTAIECSIVGKVIGPAGEAVSGAVVMITGDSPPHPDIAMLTGSTGEYRLDELIPGRYSLLVNAEECAQQIRSVDVAAGETARLDFQLEPGTD